MIYGFKKRCSFEFAPCHSQIRKCGKNNVKLSIPEWTNEWIENRIVANRSLVLHRSCSDKIDSSFTRHSKLSSLSRPCVLLKIVFTFTNCSLTWHLTFRLENFLVHYVDTLVKSDITRTNLSHLRGRWPSGKDIIAISNLVDVSRGTSISGPIINEMTSQTQLLRDDLFNLSNYW